ncbi:hypothetical protein AAHC03_026586 [Spirometra sp. Aus1]
MCISCEVINALLFICAIVSIAVGTYNLRVLNINSKDCSSGDQKVCEDKSYSYAEAYAMIAIGCILLVFCVTLITVMLVLARETSKYVRRLSNQPPAYGEVIHSTSSWEASVDDVWSV